MSDGALTPALRRLEDRGQVSRQQEVSGRGGPPRHVFRLTDAGRLELARRLAEPEPLDVTDRARFFTLLAFLHELPDPARRRAVLERRLAFLDDPGRGFFVAGQPPVEGDAAVFRAGMHAMARDIRTAERAWLLRTLATLPG